MFVCFWFAREDLRRVHTKLYLKKRPLISRLLRDLRPRPLLRIKNGKLRSYVRKPWTQSPATILFTVHTSTGFPSLGGGRALDSSIERLVFGDRDLFYE